MAEQEKAANLPTVCEIATRMAGHLSRSLEGPVEGLCRRVTGTSTQVTGHKTDVAVTTTSVDLWGRKTVTTTRTSKEVKAAE